jgi:acid stress-induced BolA-like protein IbaG/YrbA
VSLSANANSFITLNIYKSLVISGLLLVTITQRFDIVRCRVYYTHLNVHIKNERVHLITLKVSTACKIKRKNYVDKLHG